MAILLFQQTRIVKTIAAKKLITPELRKIRTEASLSKILTTTERRSI